MSKTHVHDQSYKQFFSEPVMVESLFCNFAPEELTKDLNFSTLERVSGNYVSQNFHERFSDIVWKIRWQDSWAYLLLLLEFQSTQDQLMAVRFQAYTALLWQELVKSKEVNLAKDKLPPVFPFVIYNGKSPWKAPKDVAELLPDVSDLLLEYQPRQKYFLLDIGRISEEALQNEENISVQLVRLEQAQYPEDVQVVVKKLQILLHDPAYQQLRDVFTEWIGRVVLKRPGMVSGTMPEFKNLQEIDSMLAERAMEWRDEYRQQGREEGRQEGRQEGIKEGIKEGIRKGITQGVQKILIMLLESRFKTLPANIITQVTEISDPAILSKLVLSVTNEVSSLDQFQKILTENLSRKTS